MVISVASPSSPPSFRSRALSLPSRLLYFRVLDSERKKKIWRRLQQNRHKVGRRSSGICRAELLDDAPFAAAIGACVLNSLVLPISPGEGEDGDGGGAIDSTDARLAVMGIISFIPYFNWLSWVFAWMDSSRQRYLVYSIVYLAPYLRTNFSLSPEESWLPVASIFICILHIQLEVSIRNGDLKGIQFFDEALKLLSPMIRKRDMESGSHQHSLRKERNKRHVELPSSHGLRDKVQEWGIPRKQNENLDVDEKKK